MLSEANALVSVGLRLLSSVKSRNEAPASALRVVIGWTWLKAGRRNCGEVRLKKVGWMRAEASAAHVK